MSDFHRDLGIREAVALRLGSSVTSKRAEWFGSSLLHKSYIMFLKTVLTQTAEVVMASSKE